MSKAKAPTFNVNISGTVNFNIVVKAATLEEAVTAARQMKQYEWLQAQDGLHNDYDLEITGVYK